MTLYLLPNKLGDLFYPALIADVVADLDGLIAESPQGGRSFLGKFKTKKPPYNIPLALLNEHTKADEIDFFLKPIKEGQKWGLISDAGLPCLADPGSDLIFRAHQLGIPVVTYPGASSIIMAIQLSGLPAQRFAFHGYLKDPHNALKRMEKRSSDEKALQIFIEAPYRSMKMLHTMLEVLHENTYIFIAASLGTKEQKILLRTIKALKSMPLPQLEKMPTIFALYKD